MKILLLTDSLALPRDYPEIVMYEDTWVQKLRILDSTLKIHQVSIGGATIQTLWEQFSYHKLFNPDIIIIQVGIVDCSPRALTYYEELFLNSNPITRKIGNVLIPRSKNFLRRTRKIQRISAPKFRKYFQFFVDSNPQTPVFFIQILPASEAYNKYLPGVKQNINTYNGIAGSILNNSIIETTGFTTTEIMTDHHHLNQAGHSRLAIEVFNKLKSLNF